MNSYCRLIQDTHEFLGSGLRRNDVGVLGSGLRRNDVGVLGSGLRRNDGAGLIWDTHKLTNYSNLWVSQI